MVLLYKLLFNFSLNVDNNFLFMNINTPENTKNTKTMARIVVIGAGVVGLTTALELLKAGHDVSIIARNIPGDLDINYASPFAGANWMSFAQEGEFFLQDLDKPGYHKFMQLTKDPNSGIVQMAHQRFITKSDLAKGFKYPWYKNFAQGFRELSPNELPQGCDDVVKGYEYQSVTISPSIYLNYLLQKFFASGGILQRKHINHINQAYDLHHTGLRANMIINCSGLLARFLGGVEDENVHPIRGQLLWIRNSASKQISVSVPDHLNESLYIFPRKEGGAIVGGTFIINDWSSQPDPGLTKRMIARAKKYLPELIDESRGNPGEIDVFREVVGHRPARKGGPRIERQGDIVHNYGIGGAGYQASFGLAKIAGDLVDEYLNKSKL